MASRVYVQEGIAEKFIAALKKGFEDLSKGNAIGDPSKADTQVGPLADKAQFKRVMEFMEIGKRDGSLVTGGVRRGDKGTFVEPTIFKDTPDSSRIVQEEVFGPVVTVKTFKTEEEAIEVANNTVFGLSGRPVPPLVQTSFVFTADNRPFISLRVLREHQPSVTSQPGHRSGNRRHQRLVLPSSRHSVRRLQAIRLRPRRRPRGPE